MDRAIWKDIVEWDVNNWSRAIKYWDEVEPNLLNVEGKKVLDIGGRNGGMSLFWALRGAEVYCTDLDINGLKKAETLHKKYKVIEKIHYCKLDVLGLDDNDKYDIVTFKSVLGGVGRNNNYDAQVKMMWNIYNSLKTGGYCCFVENLAGSSIHMFLRKNLRKWGSSWRYVNICEIQQLTNMFDNVKYNSFGISGGTLRNCGPLFGYLEKSIESFFPLSSRYICSVVAKK